MFSLQSIVQAQRQRAIAANRGMRTAPPAAAPASFMAAPQQPAPQQPAPQQPAPQQPAPRALPLTQPQPQATEPQAPQGRHAKRAPVMPGTLPLGRASAPSRVPSVSPAVADYMGRYATVDEALAHVAVIKRSIALRRQGFTANDVRVIRPPNYKELAVIGGAIPPQDTVSHATSKPEETPAAIEYEAQGNLIGTTGDPQAAYRKQVARKIAAVTPLETVATMSQPVGLTSASGAGAQGYTEAETARDAVAGNLLVTSVGTAEGAGNNEGGGALPPDVPRPRRSMFK